MTAPELAALKDEELSGLLASVVAEAAKRQLITLDSPIAAALDELEARRPTDPATPFCLPTMPSAGVSER